MTATTATDVSWHYARSGQQHGPVADETFRAMAARGEILPSDLVWRAGMAQWAYASSIDGLFPPRSPNEPPPIPIDAPPIDYLAPPLSDPAANAGLRMLTPIGRTPLSIIAGYLGLLSPLLVVAPFALVVSIYAVRELKRKPHAHGMGRAMFGLVMGSIFTLGLLVLGGIALLGS
jgi:hypothetical protein